MRNIGQPLGRSQHAADLHRQGPDSNPTGSPTVYRTDRESWVVQGWIVNDPAALAQMSIPEGETAVEIPDRMLQFFGHGDRDLDI